MRDIYIILTTLVFPSICFSVSSPNSPTASPNTHPVAQAKNFIRGQVVNEKGMPIDEVRWRISGIEELRDGKWVLMHYTGLPYERTTDSNGFFAIPFNRPCRYDLQFYKAGFAPAFLFQVDSNSPEIRVILKKGERIKGTVSRQVNGKTVPVWEKKVILRLPSRDFWYQELVITDNKGIFEFRACAPPIDPEGHKWKWQIVAADNIIEVEVQDGKPVDEINIEIQ